MLSPGQYLFYTGLIYFIVGMSNLFLYRFTEPDMVHFGWIVVLMVPVLFPVGKLVRGAPFWRVG